MVTPSCSPAGSWRSASPASTPAALVRLRPCQRPKARAIRHAQLSELIGRVHRDSRSTNGARRVHAELTLGHGVAVGRCAVERLMRRAGLTGISGRPRFRRIPNVATAADLVERRFARDDPDRLWVTDIVRHEALSTVR